MNNLNEIFEKNVLHTDEDFNSVIPLPMIQVKDFLPKSVAHSLYSESQTIPNEHWTEFTRNGSFMKECKKLEYAPVAFNLVAYLHSSAFIKNLEQITRISGLIPDPHLVGAGYSRSFTGDTLKKHTDFNWNDSLKLHRALSLIIYLNPDWNPAWGGALDFYDRSGKTIVRSNPCLFNSCLIWKYDKYGFHGYESPLTCPENSPRTTFRLFYYVSSSEYKLDDLPHRSLYWIDEKTNEPYDKKEYK